MNTIQLPSPHQPEQVSFQFSDFLLKRREAQSMIEHIPNPILVAGDGLADPNVVHLFDSEEAFDHWVSSTQLARKFERLHNVVSDIQRGKRPSELNVIVPTGASAVPPPVIHQPAPAEHLVLANRDMKTPISPEDQSGDLAVIYENPDFSGRWFPLGPAAVPNLSVVGLYNQISSLRVSGICMLAEKTFFYGAKLYLVGTPLLEIKHLQDWGFNDRAASAVVL